MSDNLLSQAEVEKLVAEVNAKTETQGPKFDAEKVRNNIKKYFENNNNEMPGEKDLEDLDKLRGLLGLKDGYADKDLVAAEKIAREEIDKIVASDDKAEENKAKLSLFIVQATGELSNELINSNKAKTDVLSGDDPTEAEVVDDTITPVVEPKEESGQDASSDKNEAQEFLDSQKDLIASGKAYIDSLVTQESAILPQFDKADVISQLFGDRYTDKNQIKALKDHYEDYVLNTFLEDADGKDLPLAVRARRVLLKLHDAQEGAENDLEAKQTQPSATTEEPLVTELNDAGTAGSTDETLETTEEESASEIPVEVGTEFSYSDGNYWVVKEINGDFAIIEPLGLDESNTKPREVILRDLKEILGKIEAEKAKAEEINEGLVDKYDAFRNNHNEIIDTRFEGKGGRVKKMFGGFFRNSSARVAIGMIVGVSSSLALGANPLASSTVMLTRSLTRSALSMFGFGTGNKARAIGNEQARVMKTLEYGLSDDIKRPGQEDFKEEEYNQALVENYKNISDPAEKARVLATLVEIADQKGQKINTAEYKNQIESIRKGKDALKAKNGTLARFDEYREKFSKMSLVKKIGLSAAIAIVSIGVATGVGVATGATLTTSLGALAFFKSVGLASGTIGGMLTSGAIGMASGALMSNPEKTTDYSENSALVDALGKEYFDGGGEEEDIKQYYEEVNEKFNVALAKGVGVGLVFANAMTIFGIGKDALDHFRGHGANGGNEVVPGTTEKPGMPEPNSAAKPLVPPPLTGSGQSSVPGVPEGIKPVSPDQFGPADNLPKMDEHHHAINEVQLQKAEMHVNPTRTESSTNFSDELKGVEKVDAGAGASDRYAVKMFEGLEGKGQITSHSEIDRLSMIKGISHELRESGIFDAKDGHLTDVGLLEKVNPLMIAHSAMGEVNDGVTFNDINLDQAGADQIHNQIEHHVPLETTYATLANHEPIGNAVGGQQTAEVAVVGARHGIEPAVQTDVDKHVVGATHAQPEASTAGQIDKEVASKINQANIDPAGKSFEKATTLSMNQVNKIIDPNSGNKYMDGWFGSFLRRGVEHGYLKEGDLRVMIDQAGHPQMKVNLSHFPSQESTGIASNHLGIGLKGIPENAGIDSVYKDRPWWDLRSNFVKVNTEDALVNKAAHGTGTPMPTPVEHPKVDITPEIKQNSTDGIIRFKAEDVDPTTKTDFPNSSTGHTAPEHGTNLGNSTLNGPEIPSVQDIPLNSSALMNVDTSHNYLVNIQGQDPMSVPGTQVSQMVEEAKKYFVDHNAEFENSSQERNSIWLYVLDHLKKKE